MHNTISAKRLNITIGQDTWERLKQVTPRMGRSSFIDQALRVYLAHLKSSSLKQQLKKEALLNADKDVEMANEWFDLGQEAWESIK